MNYCVQLRHTQAHCQACSRNQLHVRWFLIKSFIRQNEVKELKKKETRHYDLKNLLENKTMPCLGGMDTEPSLRLGLQKTIKQGEENHC